MGFGAGGLGASTGGSAAFLAAKWSFMKCKDTSHSLIFSLSTKVSSMNIASFRIVFFNGLPNLSHPHLPMENNQLDKNIVSMYNITINIKIYIFWTNTHTRVDTYKKCTFTHTDINAPKN